MRFNISLNKQLNPTLINDTQWMIQSVKIFILKIFKRSDWEGKITHFFNIETDFQLPDRHT